MYAIFVRLSVKPDQLAQFHAAIEADRSLSLANEPGCLDFQVHQIPDQEFEFALYERYVDEEAFRVGHQGSDHYAAWSAAVPIVLVEGSLQAQVLREAPWAAVTAI